MMPARARKIQTGLRLSRKERVIELALRPAFGSTVAVRTDEKALALTFDDGPDPETTPQVLDALRRLGMKATFFMIGARAARHPELVARIVAEGHEIGNHSWDHPSLPELPPAGVADQIARTRARLAPHGGALFRPPYGHQTLATYRVARRAGYRAVMWSSVAADWSGADGATLAGRVLDGAGPGSIVLLHDTLYSFDDATYRDRGPTLDALELIAAGMPGYRFVTVSDLLRLGPPILRYWSHRGNPDWLARRRFAPDVGQA
jgi:peptidoglycan/xylan/chitin deacetylase (PgdA/CDA1 family)